MIYSGIDTAGTFFWIFLAAIFTGAAVSRGSIISSRRRNPERSRKTKWIFVSLYLSFAVSFGLMSVFIPGADKITDIRLVYFFSAVFILSFFVIRFKIIIGIPIVSIFLFLLFLFNISLTDWTRYKNYEEEAVIKVLSKSENMLALEIRQPESEVLFKHIEGDRIAPVFQILEFPDYFFIFKIRIFYKFIGISTYSGENKISSIVISKVSDNPLNIINIITEKFPDFLYYQTCTVSPLAPVLFRGYKIKLNDNKKISVKSFEF